MHDRFPTRSFSTKRQVIILAASAGLLLVAHNPHGGEHLQDLLAGQIRWVSYSQLLMPALGAAIILCVLYFFSDRMARLGFYLVFASLIVPSLAVRHYQKGRRLAFAYLTGVGGYASGLVLSIILDLPSGALIVWCLSLLAMLVYALGPKPAASAA